MPDIRKYTDFILVLDDFDKDSQAYTVQLLPGAAWGELDKAHAVLNETEIETMLENLEADNTDGQEIVKLGKALADRLLPAGPLRDALVDAVRACGLDEGIRLRLQIRPVPLQQLPWEYTWVATQQAKDERSNFLVLNPKISIVRHPAISEPLPPLPMGERQNLRLLATMANPRTPGVDLLNLGKEKRLLENVFRQVRAPGITLEWEPIIDNLDAAALGEGLAQKPDLFHFSGHGKYLEEEQEGSLVLVENSRAQKRSPAYIQAGVLAKMLSQGGVRLAYLGACESSRVGGVSPWTGIAPALIAAGVPVVVANQYRIDDDMAAVFSRAFYSSLFSGLTVDEAMTAGRIAVFAQSGEDGVQWGVPTLYLRAQNGVLFQELTDRRASQEGQPTAITRADLQDYLRAIQAEVKDNQPKDGALRPLYALPFLVHPYGQISAAPMNLDNLITAITERSAPQMRSRSLVLLADNGVGKTPALRNLFYNTADQSLPAFESGGKSAASKAWIPFFASLRDLHGDILQLLCNSYRSYTGANVTPQDIDDLLGQINGLVLLDGLDELPASETLGGIELIRQFIAGRPKLRFIFTCRTINYRSQLGRAELMEIELLTEAQVRQVLGAAAYDALPETLQRLARYRSMLENLIRLEQEMTGVSSKGELVQYLVRQRAGLDRASDQNFSIPRAALEGLLEYLAYQLQKAHLSYFSDRQAMDVMITYLQQWNEVFNWRAAAAALEAMDIFKRNERRQWLFSDRTSQAYFAASAVANNPDFQAQLLEDVTDFRWRDSLDILVGIIDNPTTLLLEVSDREPLIAAHCYPLARPPLDKARLERTLLDALIERLGRESADGRAAIATFLIQNHLGDARSALLDALRREGRSGVLLQLVRALMELVDEPPAEEAELLKRLADTDVVRRVEVEIGLWRAYVHARQAQPDPDAARMQAIEQRLADILCDRSQPEVVTGVAGIILGLIGSDFARQTLLDDWKLGELPVLHGWCLSEGLGQIRHPEVEAAALQAVDSQAENQRVWALYVLGRVGARPAATALFKALADRKSVKVRGYAADAIGRLDPLDGRRKLEERLTLVDEDPWVLRKTIQSLGQIGTLETIPLLEASVRTGWVQLRQVTRSAINDIQRRFDAA